MDSIKSIPITTFNEKRLIAGLAPIDTTEEGYIKHTCESLVNEKQLPDIYKPKQGLGFFGYLFLLIIVGFSIAGVLRTFENDLLNNFPEAEYVFELLDEQSEYFSETFRNMVIAYNILSSSLSFSRLQNFSNDPSLF